MSRIDPREAGADSLGLPQWSGTYKFPVRQWDGSNGDTCRDAARRRIRDSARAAGHEPVGGVILAETRREYDPDAPYATAAWVVVEAVVSVHPRGAAT